MKARAYTHLTSQIRRGDGSVQREVEHQNFISRGSLNRNRHHGARFPRPDPWARIDGDATTRGLCNVSASVTPLTVTTGPPPTFYRTRDDIIHRTCTYSTPTGPPQPKCKTRPTHLQLVPDQCDHDTTTTTIQHYPMPVLNTYCNTEPNHPAATQTCHRQTRNER